MVCDGGKGLGKAELVKYIDLLDSAIANLEASQVSNPSLEVEDILCDLLEIKINLRRLLSRGSDLGQDGH